MHACPNLVPAPLPGQPLTAGQSSAMASTRAIYRAAVRAASALAPALSLLSPKLAEGHRGRHEAAERLSAWGRRSRDPARPLVWLHASSVGEGLQAESVLHELRDRRPETQYVYTHFSPSAAARASASPGSACRVSARWSWIWRISESWV